MSMAAPQVFNVYQNKGTLVPGQSISVNKYTVQVDRYLSQGGFAHVYLVRTATPVYNTTHHVLKRIAVANEAMLTDVKKEVDIMRLLKGHPNIVHLIDAAWHRMSNGLYEVFILMEFCPGGGIIDMMNRRLRERLTEAEILQIFVDVCEGVAYMHNSRPPLLHRDLKVENILQASPASFKLCDFGSATTVAPRPPSNMQEIRALEDDLNRHTTLQYRAPEMIDAHLRRPIDEKSDVWALGVLLYKLCYYTTPFEEHGPLAILNVQYRIPPYPVYSSQMNALIGSMLREHGTQRPTVFELLSQVHRLRGTKSQFQYRIPSPQPLSPRHQTHFKSPSPNSVQNTISYRQGSGIAATITPAVSTSPSKNAGVQARDKVLEAIAPMRRGRPTPSKESPSKESPTPSRPPSQERNVDKNRNWLEDEEKAWEAVTAKSATPAKSGEGFDVAWAVASDQKGKNTLKQGFGDDFGEQLWKAPDPNAQVRGAASTSLKPPASASPTKITVARSPTKSAPAARGKEKDAFDGLGFPSSEKHAPTLAEARKLRTGLAVTSSKSPNLEFGRPENGKYNESVHRPSYLPSPQLQAQSLSPGPALQPATSGSSWSSQPPTSRPSSSPRTPETLAAETRFPSLEELDATFDPGRKRDQPSTSARPGPIVASQPQLAKPQSSQFYKSSPTGISGLPRPAVSYPSNGNDGVRSEQVTGVAMRAGLSTSGFDTSSKVPPPSTSSSNAPVTRGSSIRRHRSSITMKPSSAPHRGDATESSTSLSKKVDLISNESAPPPRLPPRPSQRDWLTGDDDSSDTLSVPEKHIVEASQPVLRESPSKRASLIEKSTVPIQEGVPVTHEHAPVSLAPPVRSSATTARPESPARRAHRVFPELDTTIEPASTLTDNWSPIAASSPSQPPVDSTSSAEEEGPEDASRYVSHAESKRPRRKGRQSSVHDLVDLWGGGLSPEKKREMESVRSTVTPAPSRKHGGLERHKSLAAPASPVKSRQKSTSPQRAALSTPSRPPSTSATGASQHAPATSPPLKNSSSSSRSRPQSLFIFPSKSQDPPAPPSAGLSPPPEPEVRVNARRTSITDMVQRYEAIDAVARTRSTAPSTPKPTSLKVSTSTHETGPTSGPLPSPSKRISRSISSGPPGSSAVSLTPQPSTSSTASEEVKETEVATPRPRRISVKPDASHAPFSSRHPTIPTEASNRPSDPRSPSPDQAYQGVGRLIDQWQRKTAETAEATRTPAPKRGGFVAKRAGLVSGGNRG